MAAIQINEDFSKYNRIQDVGRWYINRFVAQVAENLVSGASVLDAGAGEGAYRRFFEHCNYRSVDLAVGEELWNYAHLDYVAPLHDLPIEDNFFDAVLCTQVLEHLEWPRESVREMFRVLKPGGTLYMTVPMAHCEHQQPYDFFRYTSFGIQSICKDAGFRNVDIEPFGGNFARWAYEMRHVLEIFPPSGLKSGRINVKGALLLPLKFATLFSIGIIKRIFLLMDRFDVKKTYPLGWGCAAKK